MKITMHHKGFRVVEKQVRTPITKELTTVWREEGPGVLECEFIRGDRIATVVKLGDESIWSVPNSRILSMKLESADE